MRTDLTRSLIMTAAFFMLATGTAFAQQPAAGPKFKLTSPSFNDGAVIPNHYTCLDKNPVSPALQWTDAPAGTVSFAMIMHDTDGAPTKGMMDYTDWIFWNLSAGSNSVAADVKLDATPGGMAQGKNVRNENGYHPPCPASGPIHHYIFELYALDKKLDLPAGSAREDLMKALEGHVIGKTSYIGVFGQ